MDDGVEMFLQVDALAQTIGRDQSPAVATDQLVDPLAPTSKPVRVFTYWSLKITAVMSYFFKCLI